jgi:hypothetical protein
LSKNVGGVIKMKKTLKYAIVITLVISLSFSFISIGAAADPTYGDIILDPIDPMRKTSVDFSVEITGDDIEQVHLRVQECMIDENGMEACSPNVLNESMTTSDDITWTATATLQWNFATIGHCWLEIKSNGTWFSFKEDKTKWTDFDITTDENGGNGNSGNGNGGNGGNGDNDTTPGFELIISVLAVVIALFIFKRKIMK